MSTREQVYLMVAMAGEDGTSATDIADKLGVDRETVRRHLGRLSVVGQVVNVNKDKLGLPALWKALEVPIEKDELPVRRTWLPPGEWRVAPIRGPVCVWDLGRR